MDDLRVTCITLENIKGVPKAELRFRQPESGKGQLITIYGDNAAGKTSILDGIASIFSGGHQPQMIRNGCEKAEARMTLSDGTDIRRTITRKGYSLKIVTAEGDEKKAPETFVKKLANSFGFDPVAFCQADNAKRLDFLLKVMPISFSADEVVGAAGGAVKSVPPPSGSIGVVAPKMEPSLNRYISNLEEKRATVGSRRDEKASTVESHRKSLATADSGDKPKDWKAELATITAARNTIDEVERTEVDTITSAVAAKKMELAGKIVTRNDAAREEFQRLFDLARAGNTSEDDAASLYDCTILTSALDDLSVFSATMKLVDEGEQEAVQACRLKAATLREYNTKASADAQAGLESQIQTQTIRTQMESFQRECAVLTAEYDCIAKAVKDLEALRRSKLDNLPVSGLEIRDSVIFVHGVEFDQINQASQWLKAIEIGAQGVGSVGLMIADEAEHLGPTNWENFEEAVIESGFYVVAARVATKVEIETFGGQLRSEPASALVAA